MLDDIHFVYWLISSIATSIVLIEIDNLKRLGSKYELFSSALIGLISLVTLIIACLVCVRGDL